MLNYKGSDIMIEYWKNGDTNIKDEEWSSIIDFSNYEVSNLGRIRCLKWRSGSRIQKDKYPYIMKQRLCKKGYCVLYIVRDDGMAKMVRVHRCVGQAFILNPHNLPQINHLNGIKTDNNIKNLEWISNKDNTKHSYESGLRDGVYVGEKNGRSIISENDVVYIFTNPDRKTTKQLSNIFGLTKHGIQGVYSGRNWSYLTSKLVPHQISSTNIFIKVTDTIKNNNVYFKNIKEASEYTGFSKYIIRQIINNGKPNKEVFKFKKCSYDEYFNYMKSKEEIYDKKPR